MTLTKKILSFGAAAVTAGTCWTLHSYNYDVNSLGFVRLARAADTVLRIGHLYKTKLYSSPLQPESPEYDQLRSSVHAEGAKMLLELCCANRGVYIKVGQHIGALDYLVPPEYVKTMKVLHSEAPSSTYEEILNVLKQDLKRDPFEIFSYIEEKPLGTASLAQVHKAVLRKDERVVAVKVQHPLVLRNSIVDMKTMEILVQVMSSVFKDFNFQWLVDESKRNLPKELDFRLEAENAEKAQNLMKNFSWLKVPRIYWDLTTKRILTMEYETGGQVNDLDFISRNQIEPAEVTSKLGEMYAHMIFKHGFVHSDPHPGNILLQNRNGKLNLILLDHGLYAELSDDFRMNYSKFWMSILSRDLNGMKTHSTAMGIADLFPLLVCMVTGRTWDSVTAGIDQVQYSNFEKETFQREIPQFLTQIGEVLQRVNRQMLLILKTNDLLHGIEHTLNTHEKQDSFVTMTRCCLENIYRERLEQCSSALGRFRVRISKFYVMCKIDAFSFYLSVLYWLRVRFPQQTRS